MVVRAECVDCQVAQAGRPALTLLRCNSVTRGPVAVGSVNPSYIAVWQQDCGCGSDERCLLHQDLGATCTCKSSGEHRQARVRTCVRAACLAVRTAVRTVRLHLWLHRAERSAACVLGVRKIRQCIRM